jgi:nucleoside-diphosphate-sugar epimerase
MIGSALVHSALEEGCEVLCIVRPGSTRLDNLPASSSIRILYTGLPDYAALPAQDKNYDVFFHLAWNKTFGASRDDVDAQLDNVRWTLDAVRLAKRLGCKKFIGAGSQAEYGPVLAPLKSGTPPYPRSGYGITKFAAGRLSKLLCTQLSLHFNWVRILSVFGPLQPQNSLIMYAIKELKAARSPEFTPCEQLWDYLYCDDAACAFLAIADKGIDGKTYPLGSGNTRVLSEYLESLRTIISPHIKLHFGVKEYYPHQPMFLCADITELTEDTGWKPQISFEDGIRKMLDSTFK